MHYHFSFITIFHCWPRLEWPAPGSGLDEFIAVVVVVCCPLNSLVLLFGLWKNARENSLKKYLGSSKIKRIFPNYLRSSRFAKVRSFVEKMIRKSFTKNCKYFLQVRHLSIRKLQAMPQKTPPNSNDKSFRNSTTILINLQNPKPVKANSISEYFGRSVWHSHIHHEGTRIAMSQQCNELTVEEFHKRQSDLT